MSAELSSLTIDPSSLQDTVGRIFAGHERLEAFLRGLLGELDDLAGQMMRQEKQVASARHDQESLRAEQEERLGRERQELDSTLEKIQELTNQLGTSAAGGPEQSEQWQQVVAGFEEERSSWQAALAATESQNAELARMAEELTAARQDLAEARDELRAQRELLSNVPTAASSGADPDVMQRLEELEQERLAWVQERAVLETELDTVRTRAAELAETIDEDRQNVASERKDWAAELRKMRELLQSLGDRAAIPSAAASFQAPAEPSQVAEQSQEDNPQDPVLDSVMAQFEILQKDLARRRKAKPAAK